MGIVLDVIVWIVRIIAYLFVLLSVLAVVAFVAILVLGYDITWPAARIWADAHVSSLNLLEAITDRYIAPYIYPDLWYDAAVPYISLPAWFVLLGLFVGFGIIGLLLRALCRLRRPR